MRRCLVSALFLGLALTISLVEALADDKGGGAKSNDGKITNWGQPKGFGPGKVNAFWIWYDDGIWHFRTTGGGKGAHRFNGQIEVAGGKLIALKGRKGEYRGSLVDRYVFNGQLTAIAFDFKTDEGVDGINFAVEPSVRELKFTLALDGQASPKHIRIGKDGDHPAGAVFVLPAHPNNAPGKGKKK